MSLRGAVNAWRRVALTALILAFLVALDWWQVNRELSNLLVAIEESETQMISGAKTLEAVFASSELAHLDDSTPQAEWDRAMAPVVADLTDASVSAAAAVQEAGGEVQDVVILPWHASLQRARDAYLDHNAAWVRYFKDVAVEPLAEANSALRADIEATFGIAERRVRAAIPVGALYAAPERVHRIFVE